MWRCLFHGAIPTQVSQRGICSHQQQFKGGALSKMQLTGCQHKEHDPQAQGAGE